MPKVLEAPLLYSGYYCRVTGPVPNYRALLGDRDTRVNDLPKVVTRERYGRESNPRTVDSLVVAVAWSADQRDAVRLQSAQLE